MNGEPHLALWLAHDFDRIGLATATRDPCSPSDREVVRFGHLALAPETFEAPACGAGVMDGMPGIAMAQVVLDEPQVVPLVSQDEPAGMTQRVRMDARQSGTLGSRG